MLAPACLSLNVPAGSAGPHERLDRITGLLRSFVSLSAFSIVGKGIVFLPSRLTCSVVPVSRGIPDGGWKYSVACVGASIGIFVTSSKLDLLYWYGSIVARSIHSCTVSYEYDMP